MNFDQLNVPQEIEAELRRLATSYEFKKLADKGVNGYLFIATNRVLKNDVAIKFYYWADGYRAHVEPRSLAAVKSDAIIDVLHASVVGDEWALFVTPYCPAGDLDRYREANRFDLRQALRFVEQLLHGVSALHSQSFVHRDLKPENILVSEVEGPLIADFGSVRLVPDKQSYVTGSGHAVLYRPPESFDSLRYDRRGDIYQCGIVLYQVLSGRLPYSETAYLSDEQRRLYASTADEVERSRIVDDAIAELARSDKLLDMGSLAPFVPNRVKRVIKKATASDPDSRFQEASDMLAAVHNCVERVLDWRYLKGHPIVFNGGEHLRLVEVSAGKFTIELDRGKGWRRMPGSQPASRAAQVRLLEDRCL